MNLLKPKQVAERLAISASAVYKMADEGRIGSYRINHGGVRISEEQLQEYLDSRIMPPLEKKARKPYTRKQRISNLG